MQNMVYETDERSPFCPYVRSIAASACGGFAAERPTGQRYRSVSSAGAQQQRRHSTALSSKFGQCHADSRCTKLNTDLCLSKLPENVSSCIKLATFLHFIDSKFNCIAFVLQCTLYRQITVAYLKRSAKFMKYPCENCQ